MICKNCGQKLKANAKKCQKCGQTVCDTAFGNGFFDILSHNDVSYSDEKIMQVEENKKSFNNTNQDNKRIMIILKKMLLVQVIMSILVLFILIYIILDSYFF